MAAPQQPLFAGATSTPASAAAEAPPTDPRPRRARPIGTRIFSLVGLGMIAPAAVLLWVGAAGSTELDQRALERDALLASSTAERVSAGLAAGLEAVNTLATQERWTLEPQSLARLRDAVRRAHAHHHALFEAFFAFDARGELVAGDTEGWAVDGALVVAEARRLGRPSFAVEDSAALADPDVVALVPVLDGAGAPSLVVGARVRAGSPRLARLLSGPLADDAHVIALHDVRGRRVASVGQEPDASPTDDEAVVRALRQAQGPTGGLCRRCAQGLGAAWAVAPVGPAHWAVLVWQPLSAAHAFERQLVPRVALASVALFGLALLFAWGATVSVTRPLRALTRAADRIAQGELSAQVGHQPGDEVGALGAALEVMRQAVRDAQGRVERLNHELEARVAERTRELSQLNVALAQREVERTTLLRQVISAQEGERTRIARELHDETCQQLAALSMGLDAAGAAVPPEAAAAREALSQLRTVVASALAEVHRLILDLRPAVLDDLGLQSAITWCAERTLSSKGVSVRCEFSGLERRLPWALETAVFRAAQEALNNVARHSKAETVLVQAQLGAAQLTLDVEDDGQGFDPAGLPPLGDHGRGLGLLGMRERLEVFGGTVRVDSSLGQGTHVHLVVPLPRELNHG